MDERKKYHRGLDSVSPLGGREILFAQGLEQFLSESALHRYRGVVEIENVIALSKSDLPQRPTITDNQAKRLRALVTPGQFDSKAVADYDHFGRNGIGPLEHDVKSVEVYLREKCDQEGLGFLKEFIHFPMTSEDVNNIAYNMMIRDALNSVWVPRVLGVCDNLALLAQSQATTPVVGKTHGMNASPTTIGKRFAYSLDKLTSSLGELRRKRLNAKFSGPVGNHNAMTAVVPEFDMDGYGRRFVERLGFEYSPIEHQRISHQAIVDVLNQIQVTNLFGADCAENIRHGVMMDWLNLEKTDSHVGSSVMPHKVNPWFFEVGQGYLEISDCLIDGARRGLISSVFERDLTDHPWERMYGEMIGNSVVGFAYIEKGLPLLRVNVKKCLDDLGNAPEVLGEAVQIAGRLSGSKDTYTALKHATRGKKITFEDLRGVAQKEITDSNLARRVMDLVPGEYVGKARDQVRQTVENYVSLKESLKHGILGAVNYA